MPALLQEIVSVYPLLSPPNLTANVSNRVCNALALLQCVASHSETRQLFLNGSSLSSIICLFFSASDLPQPIYHFFYILSSILLPKLVPLNIYVLPRSESSVPLSRCVIEYCRHLLSILNLKPAKRQQHGDPFPAFDRDHPSLPPDHGNRLRTLEDCRHFHCTEDPPR